MDFNMNLKRHREIEISAGHLHDRLFHNINESGNYSFSGAGVSRHCNSEVQPKSDNFSFG